MTDWNGLKALTDFKLDHVLNEDPLSHTITLLGTLPVPNVASESRLPAIIRVERTFIPSDVLVKLPSLLESVKYIESTDIYTWLLAWLKRGDDIPDVKINLIFPATEVHIRKYAKQSFVMVSETPEVYERVVKPYIAAFPPSRTQWVENILTGKSEAEKVLFKDPSLESGFVILPDMKWDLINVTMLYLVAISMNREIRSLRDLRREHIPMLKRIRAEANRIAKERWGIGDGGLRLYVHYQPSYYHFHVHIVAANYFGFVGMNVGQAHLLDDVISLLELSDEDGPSLLARMTLTYSLGEQHGLYVKMKAEQLMSL